MRRLPDDEFYVYVNAPEQEAESRDWLFMILVIFLIPFHTVLGIASQSPGWNSTVKD